MSSLRLTGQNAFNALRNFSSGEGWLLSVKFSAKFIELIGDFANLETELDGKRKLTFCGITDLRLVYSQTIFSTKEDDISTIDVMKLRDDGQEQDGGNHISFEFSYGTLEFRFDTIVIQ